jgi:enamine deaminase RidA (YjgF/YER057c/UK114 family)
MNEHEIILPEGWPRPRGYAHAVAATGRIITLAGQVGWDPLTETFASTDFVEQLRAALRNMNRILAATARPPPCRAHDCSSPTAMSTCKHQAHRRGYRGECGRHFLA